MGRTWGLLASSLASMLAIFGVGQSPPPLITQGMRDVLRAISDGLPDSPASRSLDRSQLEGAIHQGLATTQPGGMGDWPVYFVLTPRGRAALRASKVL